MTPDLFLSWHSYYKPSVIIILELERQTIFTDFDLGINIFLSW